MNQLLPRHAFADALARRPADCGDPADLLPDVFLARLLGGLRPSGAETVDLSAAAGRVLAEDLHSLSALPGFDQSAMDGFGLAEADLDAPGRELVVNAGREPVAPGMAARLYTGSPIPAGVVGILRREQGRVAGATVTATRAVAAGADIRRMGEDVRPGDRLAPAGAIVDPRLIALLAATGVSSISVHRRVRVAVLSTGDELIAGASPSVVRDANGPMLRALLASPAAEIIDGCIHADDAARLGDVFRGLSEAADLIVSSGGSAGSEVDVLVDAIRRAGGTATSHRLALKPGKPIVTGTIGGAILLGLPGNPFAAFVSAALFARPVIAALCGRPFAARRDTAALLAGAPRAPEKRREFLPASIVGYAPDGRPLVEPGRPGAARLAPLAAADGVVELPPHDGVLEAGQPVSFHPANALWA